MEVKMFELRDHGTFIPLLCIRPGNRSLEHPFIAKMIWRCGWRDSDAVIVMSFGDATRCQSYPYAWGDRTFHTAHLHIQENWSKLSTGDLIDVRVLLGETDKPCESEAGIGPVTASDDDDDINDGYPVNSEA